MDVTAALITSYGWAIPNFFALSTYTFDQLTDKRAKKKCFILGINNLFTKSLL